MDINTDNLVLIDALPINEDNFLWWWQAQFHHPQKGDRWRMDGDTYTVTFDRGFKDYSERKLRGNDYDTWETTSRPDGISDEEWEEHKRKGHLATEFIKSIIPNGAIVIVNSFRDKSGKYGRILSRVYYKWSNGQWVDIAQSLAINGHLKV